MRSPLIITALTLAFIGASPYQLSAAPPTFSKVVTKSQPRMVKIYGAGGIRGLEAYQSGFLISDKGHVLTVMSYVLDTDHVTVTMNSGRKHKAELLGADPRLEIAVLKIDVEEVEFFNLDEAEELEGGDRVLAFSNLFGVATGDEPTSLQHGIVAAKAKLEARRGAYKTAYRGNVYFLDAMTNNPGAAGGALTDMKGNLAGILGKELRNSQDNTWLNYAIPVSELTTAIDDILAGKVRPLTKEQDRKKPAKAHTLKSLGVTLVPNVLPKTPPFIDRIRRNSPAAKAGLKPDDLVLFINDRLAESCKSLTAQLEYVDQIDEVRLLIQRDQELLEFKLNAGN